MVIKTKILYLLILIFIGLNAKAQSALTSFALPTGINAYDQRLKGDMKIDASGNIWIAYTGRKFGNNTLLVSSIGLAQFNGTTWTTYNTTNSVLPTNYLTSLEFNGNDLWIGTKNGLVKKSTTIWTIYNKSNSGIISDSINDVKVKNGIVWVATDNGVSRFDGMNWTNYSKSNSAIISDVVKSIDADNNNNVWLGTSAGLSKLNAGIFTNYTAANSGLKKDNINSVFVDTKNNVWIAGDNAPTSGNGYVGIYKIVNGMIKPLQDIIDYCSQSYLPPTTYSFSSDANGNVYFQGVDYDVHQNTTYYTVMRMNSQIINASSLKQFNIPDNGFNYYGTGLFIQPDVSGNLWLSGADGMGNKDSLYRFNPSKYIQQPVDALWNFDKIKYLDVNKVSTPILTRGDMFWDLTSGGYEVPKGSCKKALFASALWLGGIVNGNLKLAAQTYRQSGNDYLNGPLSIGTAETDSASSKKFNKIWKISKWNIEDFKANYSKPGYIMLNDILTWPAHGDTTKGESWDLAPFVNVAGLPGKYEPQLGDYPLIKGDQMLFCIFNDQTLHTESSSFPLGVEIHLSAYAFKCDDINDNDSNITINYTTFYHYDIFNRTNLAIDSFKVGRWTDVDLGNYTDDYVGCNPKEGYGYVYNGIPVDSGWQGYGENPPAVAVVQINGTSLPSGNKQGMTNFVIYNNDWSQQGNMQRVEHYWNYLNSRWKDGTQMRYANTNDTVSCVLPGKDDPAGRPEWTEASAGNAPGDRRFLMATGPVTFLPATMQSVDYAIVYLRTSSSAIPVLPKLESDVKRVKNWFYTNSFPQCVSVNGLNELKDEALRKLLVYPNPASNLLILQYVHKTKYVNYEVYDLTGRMILHGKLNESNTIAIESLTYGLYIIKIEDAGQIHSAKFMTE